MRKWPLGITFLVLFFGAIIGSAFGELIAFLLPQGVVKQFFLRSANLGFDPVKLDLGILNFTLGFRFILNVIGIVGIAFSAYLLRRYRENRL